MGDSRIFLLVSIAFLSFALLFALTKALRGVMGEHVSGLMAMSTDDAIRMRGGPRLDSLLDASLVTCDVACDDDDDDVGAITGGSTDEYDIAAAFDDDVAACECVISRWSYTLSLGLDDDDVIARTASRWS